MQTHLVSALFVLASLLPSARAQEPAPAADGDQAGAGARRELAEIRLLVAADRKFPEARERLQALSTTLKTSAPADREGKKLLADVERLLSEVLCALGLAPVEQDRLKNQQEAARSQDKVDEAVLNALLNSDFAFIEQLGKRAAPGLALAVRKEPDALPGEVEKDPLYLLARHDPLAASTLAGELIGLSDFFWKKRLLRAVSEAHVLQQTSVWSLETPARCLAAGLVQFLEKVLDDPDVGNQALQLLPELVAHDALTPPLSQGLAAALRSPDPVRREKARKAAGHATEAQRPLFEGLLRESDPDQRAFASGVILENYENAGALLALADDSEARVRKAVAGLLSKRTVSVWHTQPKLDHENLSVAARHGPEEGALLAKFLADSDRDVRIQAWNVLAGLPTEERRVSIVPAVSLLQPKVEFTRTLYTDPLPAEVYRSLVQTEEREMLAGIALRLPGPLCFELLAILAGDADPRVASQVAGALQNCPWWEDPRAALGVVTALLDNPAGGDRYSQASNLLRALQQTPAGFEALGRWLIARADDRWLRETLIPNQATIFSQTTYPRLAQLDPELVSQLIARLFRVDADQAQPFVDMKDYWTPELSSAFRKLARDASQPIGLRTLALRGTLRRGTPDEDFMKIAGALLADPAWRKAPELTWPRHQLVEVLTEIRGDRGNALILQILRDPSLPDELAAWVIQRMDSNGQGAPEIAKLVLERWFAKDGVGPDAENAVEVVLEDMGYAPALQDPAILARAAREPRYAETTLQTIGWLRDPAYLPLLAEIVEKPGDYQQLRWAAEALFGYLVEEAAEPLLLLAAKIHETELRDRCLAQLEKIREYQDARDRWATRKVRTQTREQVLAELVAMLNSQDPATRVEAIRALATWEAVETMPRLIELLSDRSKDVAAAAREALARLNAPKGE